MHAVILYKTENPQKSYSKNTKLVKTMKKLILALILAIPAVGFSQTADVAVTASIGSAIDVQKVQDLVFGDITVNTAITIAPDGTLTGAGSGAQNGLVTIDAPASSDVVINFTGGSYDSDTRMLTLSNGGATPEDSFDVELSYEVDGVSYTPGASVTLTGGNLTIGGSIEALSTADANDGIFTATITVSVAYN
jgi:hypothetical protein